VTVNIATRAASGGDAEGDTLLRIENLLGSAHADILTGSANLNTLNGGDGNDTLAGFDANDMLVGGFGSDILIGGAGGDALDGGAGLDAASYVSSSAGVTVNLATRAASGGEAFGDSLAGIENLIGSAHADTLTGNLGINALSGDAGNDRLDGRLGNDRLEGGDGNDTLIGGAGGDALGGGAGLDAASYAGSSAGVTVNLATRAASGGDATGDTFSGIERLDGGLGSDVLAGGAGSDAFVFNTALGPANVDQITDFSVADDSILLENAIFTTLTSTGVLSAAAFRVGAAAGDADDRIIYDNASGALYYDADGTGGIGQVQFATLVSHPLGVTNADFVVV
jgi:serralysin